MRFKLFATLQPDVARTTLAVPPDDLSEPSSQQQSRDLAHALQEMDAWVSSLTLRGAASRSCNPSSCTQTGCPHQCLLYLTEQLQPHSDHHDSKSVFATSSFTSVCRSLVQLAGAMKAEIESAVSDRSLSAQQQRSCNSASPVTVPTESHRNTASGLPGGCTHVELGSTDLLQAPEAAVVVELLPTDTPKHQQQAKKSAPAAVAFEEEHIKKMLFWLCHLTMSMHKFVLQPSPTADATATIKRSAKRVQAAHVHQKQQQSWLNNTLPVILQHLSPCCFLLLGLTSQEHPISAAGNSDMDCTVPPACGAPLLTCHQDTIAADKLLLTTCFSLLSTSMTDSTQSAGKAASSKRSSSTCSAQLPQSCLCHVASMLGCHLMLKQQQQQHKRRHRHQDSKHQPWIVELCRMLQDSQQQQQQWPQLREALELALAKLITNLKLANQGSLLLCCIADAISAATSTAAGPPQQQQKLSRKQRRSSSSTAAGEVMDVATSDIDAVTLLEMLIRALQVAVDAAGTAADAASVAMRVHLLAAAALPQILQFAAAHQCPIVRKLWLQLASIAAAANPASLPFGAAAAADAGSDSAEAHQAALAAAHAHTAGISALAAAAAHDRDANVRSKALGLLQEAVSCMWWNFAYCQQQLHFVAQQQQQQQQNKNVSAGYEQSAVYGQLQPDPANSILAGSDSSSRTASTLTAQQEALCAVRDAVCSQLVNSSKTCRLKALQLLKLLLSSPVGILKLPKTAPHHPATAGQVAVAIKKQQQQFVLAAYPCISALLDAPENSTLHCPANKTNAGLLLPHMAALLEPQQALQLALSCSSSSSIGALGSTAAGKLLEGLSRSTAQTLYLALKQQLLMQEPTIESYTDVLAARTTAIATAGVCLAPGDIPASSSRPHQEQSQLQQQQNLNERLQLLRRLKKLLNGGSFRSESLRRYAFVQVVQSIVIATSNKEESVQMPDASEAALQQQDQELQQQQELLLAVQLLELSGGCTAADASPKDLQGELAILTDVLDICCYWLQQWQQQQQSSVAARQSHKTDNGSAAAAAGGATTAFTESLVAATVRGITANVVETAAAEAQNLQQHEQDGPCPDQAGMFQLEVCHQLLGSVLRVFRSAASDAVGQQHDAATATTTAGDSQIAADAVTAASVSSSCRSSSRFRRKLWRGVAASLLHHLDLVVSLTAVMSCDAGLTSCTTQQQRQRQQQAGGFTVDTLDLYLEVLCAVHSSNQLVLHELLLTWHNSLLHSSGSSSRVETVPDALVTGLSCHQHVEFAAFLLLLKHLAAFYEIEKQHFQQRLMATLRQPAADSTNEGALQRQTNRMSSQLAGPATLAPVGSAHAASESRKRPHAESPVAQDTAVAPDQTINAQVAAAAEAYACNPSIVPYMLGEEEKQFVERSTAEFMSQLVADTAPACYLPLLLRLLQDAGAPEHIKVLSLQALQPLLLCCSELSTRHSLLLAALIADPSTPAALQLQAVATAGALISAAPAQNRLLADRIQQLMLQGLLPSQPTAAAAADTSAGGGRCDESNSEVLCAAAGVYAVLLLHEKLLLAADSWKVIAAGLLAPKSQLQIVSDTMQQLVHSLIKQQRLPPIKAALGLLMNCPEPAAAATAGIRCDAADQATGSRSNNQARALAAAGCNTGAAATATRASVLVEQHILGLLSLKDLTSEELQLPLLSALEQAAAAGGWDCGHAGAAVEAAEPAAVLLAGCHPTERCLNRVLGILQAHQKAVSQPGSAATLQLLTTYVNKYSSPATATAAGKRRAAAAGDDDADCSDLETSVPAGPAATASKSAKGSAPRKQAAAAATLVKLQSLLTEATAAAATSTVRGRRAGTRVKRKAAAMTLTTATATAAAGIRRSSAKTVPSIGGSIIDQHAKVVDDGDSTTAAAGIGEDDWHRQERLAVRQLAAQRRIELQQYRASRQQTVSINSRQCI